MSVDANSVSIATQQKADKRLLQWRFLPINTLLQTKWMRQVFPKLLWFVVPLQYYYAQKLPAGFNIDSYLPSAALVVVLVASMVCAGGLIAIVYPRAEYYDAARSLISSMLGTWTFALALVCLSFWLTGMSSRPRDVVFELVCPYEPAWWIDQICQAPTMRQLLVHSIYALSGAALLTLSIRQCALVKASSNDNFRLLREPNIFIVALGVGIMMTFFQWLITTDG